MFVDKRSAIEEHCVVSSAEAGNELVHDSALDAGELMLCLLAEPGCLNRRDGESVQLDQCEGGRELECGR